MKREQVLPHVMADMAARIAKGADEYGEPLTTFNGRDALQDSYEEALDLALYLKQALMERAAIPAWNDPAIAAEFSEWLKQKADAPEWPGPDWSQAPEWAVAWVFLPWCKEGMWFGRIPEARGQLGDRVWFCEPTRAQSSQGYGYNGDWRDSLRKRPK